MIIEEAKMEDVIEVMRNLRKIDHEEAMAVCPDATPEVLAGKCMDASQYALVAKTDENEPMAAMGITPATQRTASLWLLSTDAVKREIMALTRYLRKNLIFKLKNLGVDRALVASIVTHKEAHRWMNILGGHYFCGLPGWGKHGENFELYEWKV